MAIIKVSASVFSRVKTVDRALKKASDGDVIILATGNYKESLSIQRNIAIAAKVGDEVYLEGVIIVPKGSEVTFDNLIIHPLTQFYVEGTVFINNCTFDGLNTNVLLSINGGKACSNGV
jgi:F-box protein 11